MDNYLFNLDKYIEIGVDKLLQLLSPSMQGTVEQNINSLIGNQEDVVLTVSKLFTRRRSAEYEEAVICG